MIASSAGGAWLILQHNTKNFADCSQHSSDFSCWKARYEAMVMQDSPKAAFTDVRQAYEKYDYVRTQCHQIAHVIGRTAAKKYGDVVSAYDQGDNFCWSGYYHGVMEGIATKMGPDKVIAQVDTICDSAQQKHPYGFYHYNCVHGLGHGIMAIKDNNLPEALKVCEKLGDQWERDSCYSGVFMENVMSAENPDHHTDYIKADDAMYPCTVLDQQYKQQCYFMQTSHALDVKNGDFSQVFTLCSQLEAPLDATCYQSLGRDASGRSVSNAAATKASCLLGPSDTAKSNCVIGAVKDFISYFHSDTQGLAFCNSLENTSLRSTCTVTAQDYYKAF